VESAARQRCTIATPKDLETSWNAPTVVIRVLARGDDETEGVDWEGCIEGRGDERGTDGEAVHEAPTRANTISPARRIFDGTGNSSRRSDSSVRACLAEAGAPGVRARSPARERIPNPNPAGLERLRCG
jgi:hypothetical protein